jgi:inhibitor of cysteine peptidase
MKIMNYLCRRVKKITVATGMIVLIFCCFLAGPAPAETISKTESAHRSNVKINTGDYLEIALPGNPTTGYVWELSSGDNKILPLQGDYKYTPSSKLVGSGGKFVFSFRGVAPGKTKLHFVYRRTFEKDVAPLKTFTITVNIK